MALTRCPAQVRQREWAPLPAAELNWDGLGRVQQRHQGLPALLRSTPRAGYVASAALRERIRFTLAMLPQARPLSPAYMLHQVRELLRDWS